MSTGPMYEDLIPVREGLTYCRQKHMELAAHVSEFVASGLLVRVDGDATQGKMTATLLADLPTRLARDAGLLANEIRAQLDHVANVLGRRNGANEDSASWPVLTKAEQLNHSARKQVRQISTADQQKIWDLQLLDQPALMAPIHVVHAADVFRKHRRPLGLRVQAQPAIGGYGKVGFMSSGQDSRPLVKSGDTTTVMVFGNIDSTLNLGAIAMLEVLEPPALRALNLQSVLLGAIEYVENVVVEFEK